MGFQRLICSLFGIEYIGSIEKKQLNKTHKLKFVLIKQIKETAKHHTITDILETNEDCIYIQGYTRY